VNESSAVRRELDVATDGSASAEPAVAAGALAQALGVRVILVYVRPLARHAYY
jgi:hypothetical protein